MFIEQAWIRLNSPAKNETYTITILPQMPLCLALAFFFSAVLEANVIIWLQLSLTGAPQHNNMVSKAGIFEKQYKSN